MSVDGSGTISWSDLPGPDGTLSISAQGFSLVEQPLTIERGPNVLSVSMELVPFGLLPSQACGPGEEFWIADDFQNSESNLLSDIKFNPPGWSFVDDPDLPGNLLLSAAMDGDENPHGLPTFPSFQDNVVRRFSFYLSGAGVLQMETGASDNPPAGVGIIIGTNHIDVMGGGGLLDKAFYGATANTWHLLEISNYQGTLEVWLDGERAISTDETDSLMDGFGAMLWIAPNFMDVQSAFYFDNFSLCRLTAPFESMGISEEGN
jgi:hypothetical protein